MVLALAVVVLCVAVSGTQGATFPGVTSGQQYLPWSPTESTGPRMSDATPGNMFGTAHPLGMLVTQMAGDPGHGAGWNLTLFPYDPSLPPLPAVDFIGAPLPVVSSSGVVLAPDFPSFHKGGTLSALVVSNSSGRAGDAGNGGDDDDGEQRLRPIWGSQSKDLTGVAYFAPLDVFIVEHNTTLEVVEPETGKVKATLELPPIAQSQFQSTPNLMTCGGKSDIAFLQTGSGQANSGVVAYDMARMEKAWSVVFDVSSMGDNRQVASIWCGEHDPVFFVVVETCPVLSQTCFVSGLAGFDATKANPTPLWTDQLIGSSDSFGFGSSSTQDLVVVESKIFLLGYKLRAWSASGKQLWDVDDPLQGNVGSILNVGASLFVTSASANSGYLVDPATGKMSPTTPVPAPFQDWSILPWGPLFENGWGILCGYSEYLYRSQCVYANAHTLV